MTDQEHIEIADRRDAGLFVHSSVDDLGLDVYEFRIYARICRKAGQGGAHWESDPNAARATGMSVRKVRDAVKVLEAAGLISCERIPGKTTRKWLNPSEDWKVHTPAALEQLRERTLDTTPARHAGVQEESSESDGDARNGDVETPAPETRDNDGDAAHGAPEDPSDGTPDSHDHPPPRHDMPGSTPAPHADGSAPRAGGSAPHAGDPGTTCRQGFSQRVLPRGSSQEGHGVDVADGDLDQHPDLDSPYLPTRPIEGRTLRGTILEWGARHGDLAEGWSPTTAGSLADVVSKALDVASLHLDPGSRPYRRVTHGLIREYLDRVVGEPEDDQAAKARDGHLHRLIAGHNPRNVLRVIASAVDAGAGLKPEFADDPLAITKYATAILNGERRSA